MPKSTKAEARSQTLCADLQQYGGGVIVVEWNKSRTWGKCPSITHRGAAIERHTGCGYDKLSSCVGTALRWLFPAGSDAHRETWQTAGAGINTTTATLAHHGWTLTHTQNLPNTDVFKLSRSR